MNHPPKFASWLFDWYCRHANVEDLQGDLEELFYHNIKNKSLRKARLLYWKQVISLIFSYAIRRRKRKTIKAQNSLSNQMAMLQNYFVVALRNLQKQKYFAIINIGGLAIGMSISLLIIGFITYLSSYDSFHINNKNIYRIITNRTEGLETFEYATAPVAIADRIQQEYNAIERISRINSSFSGEVVIDEKAIPLGGYFAEPEFLKIFTYPLASGNSETALNRPNQLLLTEASAEKLFGDENALGKVVQIKGIGDLEVTGILREPPKNSHFEFEVLVSYSTITNQQLLRSERWSDYPQEYVYFSLNEKQTVDDLKKYLSKVSKNIYPSNGINVSFDIQKLNDIAPGPQLRRQIGRDWDYIGITVFAILGLLILLPACFNYANISIARAMRRAKEIGLRKSLGGLRNQIFLQFITETVVVSMIALALACVIYVMIRKEFQSMMVNGSDLDLSLTPSMILYFFGFALFTGFAAGGIPAFYFSRLNPIQALKSQASMKLLSGTKVRKGLTIIQFVISFSFIIGLVVFAKQYRYTMNFDMGFQKESILDVTLADVDPDIFNSKFASMSSVNDISYSSNLPGISYSEIEVHQQGSDDSTEVAQIFVDSRFIPNFGLKLLAGKNFTDSDKTYERYIIVNEEFLKHYAISNPSDALGKVYKVDSIELEVIGVVKNFNYANLRLPIKEFFFRCNEDQFKYANLKVSSNDMFSTLTNMESTWKEFDTEEKFQAHFFEDEIAESYETYITLLKIIGFLGLLAISISCLGLLGMVVYTAEIKTKEVGIRKVMGASSASITLLLSKDYLKLMLIASMIAVPITWFLFEQMLKGIQYYRVSIDAIDVVISLFIMLALGLGAIATQTLKTAATNPADTLKYE
ncbi:MAG: FtsX-like permease family protein [Cyclobacteriaceae bacterium]|nr:FtsX-like permease family protein [Cyclobacteriaceae bacterium]